MEWIVGAYVVVGLWKAIATIGGNDPTQKPLWMISEKNGLIWALYFSAYVLIWPIIRKGSK